MISEFYQVMIFWSEDIFDNLDNTPGQLQLYQN